MTLELVIKSNSKIKNQSKLIKKLQIYQIYKICDHPKINRRVRVQMKIKSQRNKDKFYNWFNPPEQKLKMQNSKVKKVT
jgi:hypothetical protein